MFFILLVSWIFPPSPTSSPQKQNKKHPSKHSNVISKEEKYYMYVQMNTIADKILCAQTIIKTEIVYNYIKTIDIHINYTRT